MPINRKIQINFDEFWHVEKYPNTIYKTESHNMLLRTKKKVEKPIDVKKTVNELESKGLKCQDEDEELQKQDIIKMENLQVGKAYELQNPYSYGPYIEERINNEKVVHTTQRIPKWVTGDEERNFNDYGIGNKKKYTITSIQYECKKYGRRISTPKYNIGIFVYLIPQEDNEMKILKMSYELQTDKSEGKYNGWKGNTQKTYTEFLEQFKEVSKSSASKASATNTRKRIRTPSSSASRKTKRGGKKTQKRKKTQKNRGGMKVQDKKFFENKKKKIQEKLATANLFGYRQSPERNPRNMIPVDPNGIIPFQSNFNQQIEDEGNFMDAKEAGLTFN